MIYVTINQQFKESFKKQFCEKQECFGSNGINCKLKAGRSITAPIGH